MTDWSCFSLAVRYQCVVIKSVQLFCQNKDRDYNPAANMASLAYLTTTLLLLGANASVVFGRKVRFGRSVHNRDMSPPLTRNRRSEGAKVGEATYVTPSSSVQGDRFLGKEAADVIVTSEVTDDLHNLMMEQSMPMIDVMSLIGMSLSISMTDISDIIILDPEPEPGGPVLPPILPEFDLAPLFVEALVSDFCCACVVVSFLSNSQLTLCVAVFLFLSFSPQMKDVTQCASVVLPRDSCLTTAITGNMFGGFTGSRRLEDLQPSSKVPRFLQTPTNLQTSSNMFPRFLQAPTDDDVDYVCVAPDMNDETLLAILQGASVECGEVTEEEFNEVFANMKKLYAAKSCWDIVFCDKEYIATLSSKIFFDYGAKCAGVDLDIPECVHNKVIELLVMLSETDAPENPTEKEMFYLVSKYLVTPAVEQCDAQEVNKDEATSDILAILTSLHSPVCVTDTTVTKSSAVSASSNVANNTSYDPTSAFVGAALGCAIASALVVIGLGFYRMKQSRNINIQGLNEAEYV